MQTSMFDVLDHQSTENPELKQKQTELLERYLDKVSYMGKNIFVQHAQKDILSYSFLVLTDDPDEIKDWFFRNTREVDSLAERLYYLVRETQLWFVLTIYTEFYKVTFKVTNTDCESFVKLLKRPLN